MNLAATQYSLKDRAYDLFLSGCVVPHCQGCHNPDLWDFTVGKKFDVEFFRDNKAINSKMVDKIRIMGGEPFDQPLEDLMTLIDGLQWMCPDGMEIWLFTKYLPQELSIEQLDILQDVHYVKHGRYLADKPSTTCNLTGITLASDNQYVVRYRYW